MKWQEVRELYPNQFVLIKVLDYNEEENQRFIEEVAVIKPIEDSKEAAKLLTTSKSDEIVYHIIDPVASWMHYMLRKH